MSAGDRQNFSGDLSLTAPSGGVTRGLVYLIGGIYVVARETAAENEDFLAAVTGPIVVTKTTGASTAFSVGDEVFFSTDRVANSGIVLLGFALSAAADGDTEVTIQATGLPVTAT